jgi:arginase
MVAAEPADGLDAAQPRHVQVDDDGVRSKVAGEPHGLGAVVRDADHCQLGLPLDQLPERRRVRFVVVREEDANFAVVFPVRHVGFISPDRFALVASQETLRPVAVIGAALDLGAGRRGVDMGPSAIRYAGLAARIEELGRTYIDLGNVETVVAEASAVGDERLRYLEEILLTCRRVADEVAAAVEEGQLPLVLGGDHSVALGTLGGLARVRGAGGVLWIDAHGDLNRPESSPTGNVHGMVLAAAMGLGGPGFESAGWPVPSVDPSRVALVGVRSLDEGERALLRELNATVFTMSDVDRLGVEHAVKKSLEQISGAGFVHVSLDMDALDPDVAPGVGTPVRGGLSYREAHLAMEIVAESGLAQSLEVVEVNPILDRENETATLAVELVASALGARIL